MRGCVYLGGNVTSLGGNVESPGDTCGFDHGTDQTGISIGNLDLQTLADNGGPTETHAIGSGSAAEGSGVEAHCLELDQRGFFRTQSPCDSGAFELDGENLLIFEYGFELGIAYPINAFP